MEVVETGGWLKVPAMCGLFSQKRWFRVVDKSLTSWKDDQQRNPAGQEWELERTCNFHTYGSNVIFDFRFNPKKLEELRPVTITCSTAEEAKVWASGLQAARQQAWGSALLTATGADDVQRIQILMSTLSVAGEGVTVNVCDADGNTPLMLAVRHGRLLVEINRETALSKSIGDKWNVNAMNNEKKTALDYAVQNGMQHKSHFAVSMLISIGAKVDIETRGENGLLHAVLPARKSDEDTNPQVLTIIEAIAEAYSREGPKTQDILWTEFLRALDLGLNASILLALAFQAEGSPWETETAKVRKPIDFNWRDDKGLTLFMKAAQRGDSDTFGKLILCLTDRRYLNLSEKATSKEQEEKGNEALKSLEEDQDSEGNTILTLAAKSNDFKLVEMVMRKLFRGRDLQHVRERLKLQTCDGKDLMDEDYTTEYWGDINELMTLNGPDTLQLLRETGKTLQYEVQSDFKMRDFRKVSWESQVLGTASWTWDKEVELGKVGNVVHWPRGGPTRENPDEPRITITRPGWAPPMSQKAVLNHINWLKKEAEKAAKRKR